MQNTLRRHSFRSNNARQRGRRALRCAWRSLAVSLTIAAGNLAAQPASVIRDNVEVAAIAEADQAERVGSTLSKGVEDRDRARRMRILSIYQEGGLGTANDYFNAALVLQHGQQADDFLLAHELAIVSLSKGHPRGRWLAAATEDRFLMTLGRPQRFGTQYVGSPGKLHAVADTDHAVTDQLRRELSVPTIAEARAREQRMAEDALPPEMRLDLVRKRAAEAPNDRSVLMRLAQAYRDVGRPDDARQTYQMVICGSPDYAVAYYNLACLEATEGHSSTALDLLADAARLGYANAALAERDEELKPLRSSARFGELVKQMRRNAAARVSPQ